MIQIKGLGPQDVGKWVEYRGGARRNRERPYHELDRQVCAWSTGAITNGGDSRISLVALTIQAEKDRLETRDR